MHDFVMDRGDPRGSGEKGERRAVRIDAIPAPGHPLHRISEERV